MADAGFPQIPATVWWSLRSLLRQKPRLKIDEATLGVELSVQESAARQYISELQKLGILDSDRNPTDLANRWKFDEDYRSAAEEILGISYPEALLSLAPVGQADRAKVTDWFMRQGLGEGAAKNKAATYVMIANEDVQDPGALKAPKPKAAASNATPRQSASKPTGLRSPARASELGRQDMPLHVNVQIHIGADASKDQIESIFSAMRRHLYGNDVD